MRRFWREKRLFSVVEHHETGLHVRYPVSAPLIEATLTSLDVGARPGLLKPLFKDGRLPGRFVAGKLVFLPDDERAQSRGLARLLAAVAEEVRADGGTDEEAAAFEAS